MSPEQALGKEVDPRSDIFSIGVVLYEMATGRKPFSGATASEMIDKIVHAQPEAIARFNYNAPAELERIIRKCLEKNRERRYQTMPELLEDLRALAPPRSADTTAAVLLRLLHRPHVVVVSLLVLVDILFGGSWLVHRNARIRWAREKALPEIARLAEKEEYLAAFDLAREAERYLAGDREFAERWASVSRPINIDSSPTGADVHYRSYGQANQPWRFLGGTPVRDLRVPRNFLEWKIEKSGFASVEDVGLLPHYITLARFGPEIPHTYVLETPTSRPPGMVRVSPRGPQLLAIAGLEHLPPFEVQDFWIDRCEVTNRDFKKFVDDGGYRDRRFWNLPFRKGTSTVSWEEAMADFRDATGRPGPATWRPVHGLQTC